MTVLVPYVIEKNGRDERAMDIYSRLLKDRIVILGSQVNDDVANSIVAQLLFLQFDDPRPTFTSTSTALADRSPPEWRSTTRCNTSVAMWPRIVSARQQAWEPSF